MRRLFALALCLLATPALAFTGRLVNLGDAAITTAVTNQTITSGVSAQSVAIAYVDRLEGAQALTLYAGFAYGSGGSTCAVIVETTLNDVDWVQIARFDFTTASAARVANLSGFLSKAVTAVSALGSEGVNDGVLGPKMRVRITSTGTYANTTVSVRAALR